MVLILDDTQDTDISLTKSRFRSAGYRTYELPTARGNVFTVLGVHESEMKNIEQPHDCFKPDVPYILASKKIKDIPTVIRLKSGITVGGNSICVMAGPCSIESEEQIRTTAREVSLAGASVLRGGAFKPRTSPYAFQGMGLEGLKLLRAAGDACGLPIITEVMDTEDIPVVSEYSDIIQVGARNCQNFALLKKLGKTKRPILLKRGMMTTIQEFLMSAEYILSEGNMEVILCERGIRTFETETRSTLDISAVPVLKKKTHLPVIVDPSHAAGDWNLIEPLSMAAIAAGADGLIVEVHPTPETALCDGPQSLKPEKFARLMAKISGLSALMDRGCDAMN